MSSEAFRAGVTVQIEGRKLTLLRKVTDTLWQLEDEQTRRISEYEDKELRNLYLGKELTFWGAPGRGTVPSRVALTIAITENSEQAKLRRLFVKAVLKVPNTKAAIESAIQPVWEKLNANVKEEMRTRRPGWTSVYRWKKRYQEAGEDFRVLQSADDKKGNRTERYPEEVEALVEKAIEERYLTLERRTLQDTLEYAMGLVVAENKLRPLSVPLPLPTRTYLLLRIARIPEYDRYAARYGRTAATKRYRGVVGSHSTSAPLERAEIDHTLLDMMVIDDVSGLPLGRPWLTVCIDCNTRCVLGIYISFEPPSHFTVSRCLKHAFLPKTNLREVYPSIVNEWDAHGVMREIVVDNGVEFHSVSMENACFSLGIEIHYSARKTPWFKGKIERFQGTLNRAVAHGNPGTTFSNIFEKEEYDPSKHAVIRYSTLKEIVFKWIADVYHQQPHRSLQMPPAVMWNTSISNEEIRVPTDTAWLDAILGRSEVRRLTHKGIELDSLFYNSHELTKLRRKLGTTIDVEVRVDNANLGSIIVFAPDRKQMFTVPAVNPAYANGLTEWQHRVCKRFAATRLAKHSPEAWLEAKMQIAQLIEREFMHKKQRTRTKVARFKESAPPVAPSATPTPAEPPLSLEAPTPVKPAKAAKRPKKLPPEPMVLTPPPPGPKRTIKPIMRERTAKEIDSTEDQ